MEIVFTDVSYKYRNKKILNSINFTIKANKITGITGDNKTLICDILDATKYIDKGFITIGDIPLIKDNVKVIRKIVSLINQDYNKQFFTNNIYEEVKFLVERLEYKPKDIDKKIDESLSMVGLKRNKYALISSLTEAEKKLLQIAVSLIFNPDIIIFDESFNSLDKVNKRRIIKLIKALKTKYNKTIIISSNDVDLLYSLVDEIIIIKKGNVLVSGDIKDIYENERLLDGLNIDIPLLSRFTFLSRKKKQKISFHKDYLDLIKDVYRHV